MDWKIVVDVRGTSFEAVKSAAAYAVKEISAARTWADCRVNMGFSCGDDLSITVTCTGPLEAQLEEAKKEVQRLEAQINGQT